MTIAEEDKQRRYTIALECEHVISRMYREHEDLTVIDICEQMACYATQRGWSTADAVFVGWYIGESVALRESKAQGIGLS